MSGRDRVMGSYTNHGGKWFAIGMLAMFVLMCATSLMMWRPT